MPRMVSAVVLASGAIALAVLGLNAVSFEGRGTMFVAPFAASLMLAVSAPDHPASAMWAIIGGHTVSAASGMLAAAFTGGSILTFPAAAALAFAAMAALGARHAPAMATAIVCTGADPAFLLYPVLPGAVAIAALAAIARHIRRPAPSPPVADPVPEA